MCTIWIRETFCPKPKLSPRLEMCMCEVCTIESICNYLLFEWAVCTSTISPPFALDQTKTQNPKVGENHCENGNPVVNFLSLKKIFSPSRSIKENRLYSAMFNYADEKTQKVFQDRKEIKIEIWNTWKYIQEKYPCVNPHLHQLWPFFEHPVNNSLTFTKFTNIWQVPSLKKIRKSPVRRAGVSPCRLVWFSPAQRLLIISFCRFLPSFHFHLIRIKVETLTL